MTIILLVTALLAPVRPQGVEVRAPSELPRELRAGRGQAVVGEVERAERHRRAGLDNQVCLLPPGTKRRQFFLSAAIVCRDEVHSIEEWALHYLAEGVEHIYVIDQATTTTPSSRVTKKNSNRIKSLGPTARVLQRALHPNVTTFVAPPPLASRAESRSAAQYASVHGLTGHLSVANMPNMAASYRALTEVAARETSWLLILDSDEFLFATGRDENIASVLRRFQLRNPNAGQVSVPWQIFGSSNHVLQPACMAPAFTWRWSYPPPESGGARSPGISEKRKVHGNAIALVKSIVRLDALPWQQYRSSQPWAVHAHRAYVVRQRNVPRAPASLSGKWQGCDGCLCPKWIVLNAAGDRKSAFDAALVKALTGRNLERIDWIKHDFVDLAHAELRLHHYKFRSKQWMLRVKACRSLPLLGQTRHDPAEAVRLSKLLQNHARKEDDRATVCDVTLASRRRARPAGALLTERTAAAISPSNTAVDCSNGAFYKPSLRSSKSKAKHAAVPLRHAIFEPPENAHVSVGKGCGLLEEEAEFPGGRGRVLRALSKLPPSGEGGGFVTAGNDTGFQERRLAMGPRPTRQWTWPQCPDGSEDAFVVHYEY